MTDLTLLEQMALLGPERSEVRSGADAIAHRLNPDEDPELALRVLICRFLASEPTPDTLAQLATAEAWASQEGLTTIATRIQLLWFSEVARLNMDAVDMSFLNAALTSAERLGTFEVESLLAKAACDPEHRDTHLQRALEMMDAPHWAGLAYRAWLDLSAALRAGADTEGAERALGRALDLAVKHQDHTAEIEARAALALSLIGRGQLQAAMADLERVLTLSRSEENDLMTIVAAELLCPLYLDQQEWALAAQTADIMLVAGARRANWFAVVDGHIVRSTLSVIEGQPREAISRLVRAAVHLRELVPAAAVNLLKGRLAELRNSLGAAEFDAHYQAAMVSSGTH